MNRIKIFPVLFITLSILVMLGLSACETRSGYSGAVESLNNGYYGAALKEFRKLSLGGSAPAQWRIGIMYEKGLGVSRDHREAVKWYRKAAEQGTNFGQISLGSMYERGLGVTKYYREAVEWYQKSAEQGFRPAKRALARIEAKGNPTLPK